MIDDKLRERLLACPWCETTPRYSPRLRSLGEAVECENEKCPVRPSSHSMRKGGAIAAWNARKSAIADQLASALDLARNRLRAAAINEAPVLSAYYYEYSKWADEADQALATYNERGGL